MIFDLLPRFPSQILWFEKCGDFSFVAKVSSQILWFEKCGDFSFVAKVSLSNIVVQEVW